MNNKLAAFACLLLLAGVCYIATASIGIQCKNDNPNDESSGKGFLISQLVSAILITLISFVGLYMAVTDMPMPEKAAGFLNKIKSFGAKAAA